MTEDHTPSDSKPTLSLGAEPQEPEVDPKEVAAKAEAAKERAAAEAELCDSCAKVVKVLRHLMGRAPACLLTAHIFLVECHGDHDKMSALGGTEVEDFARGFARLRHAATVVLQASDSQAFHDALQREKHEVAGAQDYLEVAAILRRANP